MTSVLFDIDKKVRHSRFGHYAAQKMAIVRELKRVAHKATERGDLAREAHRRTSQYLSFITKSKADNPKVLEQQAKARLVLSDMHATAAAFDELAAKITTVAGRMEEQLLHVIIVDDKEARRKRRTKR